MNKNIKIIMYSIIAISLCVCAFIGATRIAVEGDYRDVQIVVRYNDVLRIAKESEKPIEEVLADLKEEGATTLLVRENVVATSSKTDLYTLRGTERVRLLDGYIAKLYYEDIEWINPEKRYVITEDAYTAKSIYDSYTTKGYELEYIYEDNVFIMDVADYGQELATIGVGFDTEVLNLAASLGYTITPQVKSWKDVTSESLEYMGNQIRAIDNVSTIYFADAELPDVEDEIMIELGEDYQLGYIEFTTNKQKGFKTLAKKVSHSGTDYNVVRLHTIGDSQIKSFTPDQLNDRYELGLRERNLRAFLFKMPQTKEIEEDVTYLNDAINGFEDILAQHGYNTSATVPAYNFTGISPILAILAGLAAIMMFVLLVMDLGYAKLGYGLGILGVIGYTGLLKLNVTLASQAMALFGSIIFPTYAVIKAIKKTPQTIQETIISFVKICLISFGGVLTIIGTLSRTSFALGIDIFAGVKVATVAPIALIILVVMYQNHKFDFKYYKSILDKQITYGQLIILALLGLILFVYITRTGNTGTASTLEIQFRQFLDNLLGVRPRTKEFLIAYPILICLLRFGYKEVYLPLVAIAAIGPISLVNTYAHIHTPITISLLRSLYGMVFGIVIGIVLIWILNLVGRKMKTWQIK